VIAFLVGRAAYSWTLFVNVSNNAGLSRHPSIAIDSNNTIHVVWSDNTATYQNNFDILYKTSTNGGLTWSSPRNLSDTKTDSSDPIIAAAGPSNIIVVWIDGGRIVARIWNGTSWSSIAPISPYENVSNITVAIVPTGEAIVTWTSRFPTKVNRSRWTGLSWSGGAPEAGERSAIAMRGDIANYTKDTVLWMSTRATGFSVWSSPVNLPVGYSPPDDMELDSKRKLYMAWYAPDGVKVGFYDGQTGKFGPVTMLASSTLRNPFKRLGLAINGNDEVTLIWTETDKEEGTYPDIRQTYRVMASQSKDGLTWTAPSRVLTPGACSSAIAGAATGTTFYGVVQSPDCGSGQSPDVFVVFRSGVQLPRAYLPLVVR